MPLFMARICSKAPNSKLQAPEKFQAPSLQNAPRRSVLELEIWCFSGAWSLEFGAFSQLPFRRRQLPRHSRVSLASRADCPGKCFKKRLHNMMRLIPIQKFQMQIAPGFIGKSLKELTRQTKPESAGHILPFFSLTDHFLGKRIQPTPNQVWPPAKINNAPRQAFVHRHIGFRRKWVPRIKPGAVTPNPFLVSQRLKKSLAQRQPAIFHRMMRIHFPVPFATN